MTRQVLFYKTPAMMNTVMVLLLWSVFPDAYLDRGFPLKSAISKALQNLMLSGISGMSTREREKKGGGDENQCHGHRTQEVWVTFCEMNHFKFSAMAARWSGMDQEKQEKKQKPGQRVEFVSFF